MFLSIAEIILKFRCQTHLNARDSYKFLQRSRLRPWGPLGPTSVTEQTSTQNLISSSNTTTPLVHLLSHFNVLSAVCSEILLQQGLLKKHISSTHPLGVMPDVSFCYVFTWLCKYPVPKSNPRLIIKPTDTGSTLNFTDKRVEQFDAVEKQKPGTSYPSTSCFRATCCHTVSFTQQSLGRYYKYNLSERPRASFIP